MNDKVLKIAGLIFLIKTAFDWLSNQVLKQISYGTPKIDLKKTDITGIEAVVELPITNNTPTSVQIQNVEGGLFYGNDMVAPIRSDSTTITANTTTIFYIETKIAFDDLAEDIVNIIASQEYLRALRFKGNIKAMGLVFPVDEKLTLV